MFTNSPLGLAFGASAVSGVVVALAICPLDVTTVRLYNQGWYKYIFKCVYRFKESLLARGYFQESPMALSFIVSIVCGVIVVCVETPLDVVNTRLYNQGSASTGAVLYNGIFDCLTKIYRTEGLHGLYKGLGPLYLRIAPHTTLSLVIWDMLNNLLDKSKKDSKVVV